MNRMKFIVCVYVCTQLFISCGNKAKENATIMDSPFVTVVKLISAEQDLYYNEAKQYIDIVQVYTKLGSENPEEDWKQWIKFQYNIGKDKKFSNNFRYFEYDIEETVNGNNAIVCLQNAKNNEKITYRLEKRQKKWIVVSIGYVK